jgi:hypothetical protein
MKSKEESLTEQINRLRFKAKRAQYQDHLMDMDKYNAEADLLQEELNNIISPHKCRYIKREGESCTLNNNCKYPKCDFHINDGDEDIRI